MGWAPACAGVRGLPKNACMAIGSGGSGGVASGRVASGRIAARAASGVTASALDSVVHSLPLQACTLKANWLIGVWNSHPAVHESQPHGKLSGGTIG